MVCQGQNQAGHVQEEHLTCVLLIFKLIKRVADKSLNCTLEIGKGAISKTWLS